MPLQIRRGTSAEVNSITPLIGEIVYDSTLKRIVVGDGTTQGGISVAGINLNEAKDSVSEVFLGGNHKNISFSYNSASKVISATVTLDQFELGTINASIIDNSSTTLVDSETGVIRCSDFFINEVNITSDGTNINLPAGTTIDGNEIEFYIGTDDSTTTTVSNADTINILGDNVNIFTAVNEEGYIFVYSDIRQITPQPDANETTAHFIPFLSSFNSASTIKCDGTLNYIPDTGTLAVDKIFADTSIGSPALNTTVLTTGTIYANNVLEITAALNTGTTQHLVQVGSNSIDGRFRVFQNSYKSLSMVVFDQYHSTPDVDDLRFNRGRGTSTATTAVQTGDDIADISFAGHDGTAMRLSSGISARVMGTVSSGVVPGELLFNTTNSTGTYLNAVEINSSQQTTFKGAITLATYADAAARNTAIPTPTAGMMVYITGTGKFQGYNGSTTTWDDLN